MRMDNLYLICNAHIDPIWQWNENEGIQSVISTFESAANLAEEYDYIFCHNEALLYQWMEKYAPKLFKKIQKLVKKGKWRIMGGWYLQPDCNIPCGESMVRQIIVGKEYFKEKFQSVPTVATNFDSFGHGIGLPQILKKTGYQGYICCRPSEAETGISEDDFIWVGIDGSEIRVKRDSGNYNSALGHAIDKIKGHITAYEKEPFDGFVMWGVGNHGGGPSGKDLDDIAKLMKTQKINIKHSYPEEYFEKGVYNCKTRITTSLNRSMPGCYTSQVDLKLKYRELENSYFFAEKICTSADMLGLSPYPFEKLHEAEKLLLFSQFHDILPGTTVESAFKKAMNAIAHGQYLIDEIIFSAFNAYLSKAKRTKEGMYPVYVFSPDTSVSNQTISCEFMLADQNWTETETIFECETALCQVVKEESNIPIDWRKRVLLSGEMKPMTLNVFSLIPKVVNVQNKPMKDAFGYILQTEDYRIKLSEEGFAEIYFATGRQVGNIHIGVYQDNEDPWIMQGELLQGFQNKLGIFSLADAEQCKKLLGSTELPIRLVETGEIRDEIEVVYTYGKSWAVVTYVLDKKSEFVDLKVRLMWQEQGCAAKLVVNTNTDGEYWVQAGYGEETFPKDGKENPTQKYCSIRGKNETFAILNNGVYASSCQDGILMITLARGACYCAHPIGAKKTIREDRFNKGVDCGEHCYSFRLISLKDSRLLQNKALSFNEQPYVLSAFGRGDIEEFESAIIIDGNVELSSMRKRENGTYVIRLFHNSSDADKAKVTIPPMNLEKVVDFRPYEIVTVILKDGQMSISEEII